MLYVRFISKKKTKIKNSVKKRNKTKTSKDAQNPQILANKIKKIKKINFSRKIVVFKKLTNTKPNKLTSKKSKTEI